MSTSVMTSRGAMQNVVRQTFTSISSLGICTDMITDSILLTFIYILTTDTIITQFISRLAVTSRSFRCFHANMITTFCRTVAGFTKISFILSMWTLRNSITKMIHCETMNLYLMIMVSHTSIFALRL